MATSSKHRLSKPPWDGDNPKDKSGTSKSLSASAKASAKRSAKRAGRPYPNLVDNMQAARKDKAGKS
jgi:hypothetical protein